MKRQSSSTWLIPQKILEMPKNWVIIPIFSHKSTQKLFWWPKIIQFICLFTKTHTRDQFKGIEMISELIPFSWESLPVGRNFENKKFRYYGHVVRYQRPQMGSKILGASRLTVGHHQNPSWVHPFFNMDKTNLKSKDFEMLRKTRQRA